MNKKFSLILIFVVLMLVMTSCSSNPLIGPWKDDAGTIDFTKDNTILVTSHFGLDEGAINYTIDGKVLVLDIPSVGKEEYLYEISGTSLSLKSDGEIKYELMKTSNRTGVIKPLVGTMLGFVVNMLGNYGIAIIIFTILIKLVLLPISINQQKSSMKMQKVSPIIKKINEKYKNDKQKAQEKTMELYKKAKINPFAGCLPMIVNMAILIAFFRVLLYPEVYIFFGGESIVFKHPDILHGSFLWVKDLSNPDLMASLPGIGSLIPAKYASMIPGIMPILTALLTLFSFNSLTAGQPEQANNSMMKGMKYMMPLMFLFMGAKYPAALMLYWTVSSIFQMVQQPIIKKLVNKEVE